MPRHHFVPVSIISTFASLDAWRVVDAPKQVKIRISEIDRQAIQRGIHRKFPIIVYEKRKKRLTRKLAKDLCSQPNLYALTSTDDQITRGLIRYNLELADCSAEQRTPSLRRILNLGKDPLDIQTVERSHISKLDGEFARLIPLLRAGQPINNEQLEVILRYITLSRFRTPVWKRVYYPETFKRVHNALMPILLPDSNRQHISSIEELTPHEREIIDSNLYQMAILEAANGQSNALRRIGARILILRSDESFPFTTCDNPGRPYRLDRIRRIPREALPGMADPRVRLAYAIDPNTCIMVSSNPEIPLFSYGFADEKQVRRINTVNALVADEHIILPGLDSDLFEDWLDLSNVPQVKRP